MGQNRLFAKYDLKLRFKGELLISFGVNFI